MDVPVLLIVWRRPRTLHRLINALRPVAPRSIYVACDAPRLGNSEEAMQVARTRELIDTEINWDCCIHKFYATTNLGCSRGPIHAISWFFDQVEEGIVLEDDCIPHPDFFSYCAELLCRYRTDKRVWCISGSNFQGGHLRGDGSYYFSRYNHCWGWASWRRCWRHFDPSIERWPLLRASGLLESIFSDPLERQYWTSIWDRTYEQGIAVTWWDYQWTFTCMINGGLTALPNANLVSNIGFGSDATHTSYENSNLDSAALFVVANTSRSAGFDGPFKHPSFVLRDEQADRYEFDHKLNGIAMRRRRSLWTRLLSSLRRRLVRSQS